MGSIERLFGGKPLVGPVLVSIDEGIEGFVGNGHTRVNYDLTPGPAGMPRWSTPSVQVPQVPKSPRRVLEFLQRLQILLGLGENTGKAVIAVFFGPSERGS